MKDKNSGNFNRKSLVRAAGAGLVLVLTVSLLPVHIFAEDAVPETIETEESSAALNPENDPETVAPETELPETEASPDAEQTEPAAESSEDEGVIEAEVSAEAMEEEATAEAAVIASGNCGSLGSDSVQWSLTDDGILTISGSGAMDEYYDGNDLSDAYLPPWLGYAEQITKLVMGEGVTTISRFAFRDCFNLKTVTFSKGLLDIENYAFQRSGLTKVTLPTTVKTIGTGAFADCSKLKSAKIRNKVSSLYYTFDNDPALKTVSIGKGVKEMRGTFRFCTSLNAVTFTEGSTLTTIGWGTFGGCSALTEITLPESVTAIDKQAFQSSGLTSLTLPSAVKTIGKAAFDDTGISSVTLPASVEQYWKSAFPDGAEVTRSAGMSKMSDDSLRRSDLAIRTNLSVTSGQKTARKMFSSGLINDFRSGSEAWYWNLDNTKKIKLKNLSSLKYDYGLEKIAMQRAAEIAANFSHVRPDGSSCFTAYATDDNGNKIYSVGENIAAGYTTYSEAMEGWKETAYFYDGQAHRRNLLSSDFTAIGIGHVVYNGVHYWVQEFGYSKSSTARTAVTTGKVTFPIETFAGSDQINSMVVYSNTSTVTKGIGMSAAVPRAMLNIRFNHGSYSGLTASKKVSWTSSDTSVAEIRNEKIVAVGAGSATLTASVAGQTLKVKVNVLDTPKIYSVKQRKAGGVIIKWRAVEGADKYRLFRKTGNGSWQVIADTENLKYTDKTVKSGKTYTYTVRCINSAGTSYTSNYDKTGKSIKY